MADSVFLNLGIDDGGPFSGQSIGPAADNTAAPPFTFLGDLNTGLGSSAADTLDLITGGTSRFRVSTTGITATLPLTVSSASLSTFAGPIQTSSYVETRANSIALTPTASLYARNTTAATGGTTVQMSPYMEWRGNAWDTSASQTVDFRADVLPATAATPTGTWRLGYSLNGAAATYPLTVTSAGRIDSAQLVTTGTITSGSTFVLANYAINFDAAAGRGDFNQLSDGVSRWRSNSGNGISWDVLTTNGTANIKNAANNAFGNLGLAKILTYNSVATAGWGVPAIYGAGRVTAQSAANSSIATYTVGASDGSFEVSANMNVTVVTTLVTTLTCTYTDESNAARTMVLPVSQLSGSFIAAGAITGLGAWETPTMHIRCKASTAITILTSAGTFTGVTYTAEGIIRQLA